MLLLLLQSLWRDLLLSTLLCTAAALLCHARRGPPRALLCSGAAAALLFCHRDAAYLAQPLLAWSAALLLLLLHAPWRPRLVLLALLLFANLALRTLLARAGLLITLL